MDRNGGASLNASQPSALEDLALLHKEIVEYILNLLGKQRPSPIFAAKRWGLSKIAFEQELQSALTQIRKCLRRTGISSFSDLDLS